MSDKIEPAFPRPASEYTKNGTCPDGNDAIDWAPGMSLRDYFAGQALQGMHARDSYDEGLATPEQRARVAFIDADAMLAERKK